jgi:hypothetical protein
MASDYLKVLDVRDNKLVSLPPELVQKIRSNLVVKYQGRYNIEFPWNIHIDGRFGVVVGILVYYARGRGFDSRTVQTIVCMNMSVYLFLRCSMVERPVRSASERES